MSLQSRLQLLLFVQRLLPGAQAPTMPQEPLSVPPPRPPQQLILEAITQHAPPQHLQLTPTQVTLTPTQRPTRGTG